MLKKVIGINASGRKNWNCAKLLKESLKGAASKGAETELIHLCDLKNIHPCQGCVYCKSKRAPAGACAIKDDFTPLFEKIKNADALILSQPIYFSRESGYSRMFTERFIFPWYQYTSEVTKFPKKMNVGLIFTMNCPEDLAKKINYDYIFNTQKSTFDSVIGPTEVLKVYNTLQVKDYSKYNMTMFNPIDKHKYRKEHFPIDLDNAYQMGQRLVE